MKTNSSTHDFFIGGRITSSLIAKEITHHGNKNDIGAHAIFLGQVRADEIDKKKVKEIIYSAYHPMAENKLEKIRNEAIKRFKLKCVHIYHSEGAVAAGEISLFVFVSSAHRKKSFKALHSVVEKIKETVPIWKNEIFSDGTKRWLDEQSLQK